MDEATGIASSTAGQIMHIAAQPALSVDPRIISWVHRRRVCTCVHCHRQDVRSEAPVVIVNTNEAPTSAHVIMIAIASPISDVALPCWAVASGLPLPYVHITLRPSRPSVKHFSDTRDFYAETYQRWRSTRKRAEEAPSGRLGRSRLHLRC